MDISTMKNMIILKNLPSNMVEEAFVVLKSNIKLHNLKSSKSNVPAKSVKGRDSSDYVVKEAEMVITEYLSHLEKKDYEISSSNKKLIHKYKKMKNLALFLGIFCFISIIFVLIK